jgi:hypothetical protein
MILIFASSLFAQNETDAFRYSQLNPTGSARYTGMSGAMGAFGADFSVLSASNPAGIGLFKRFEISLTPAVENLKTVSNYNDYSQRASNLKLVNNSFGLVLPINLDGKWKSIQLATGINNLARYNTKISVSGDNIGNDGSNTNFVDYLVAKANGTNYDVIGNQDNSTTSVLNSMLYDAWYYWLMDTNSATDQYTNLINDALTQDYEITSKGYLNEYLFSFGANYNDKLYLGFTLGVPFFRYSQDMVYTETAKGAYIGYHGFDYEEEFSARATGVNAKLGILYQPATWLRFGAAFHSPTMYFNVTESYNSGYKFDRILLDSGKTTPSSANDYNIDNEFKYQLVTPWQVMFNLAFLSSKIGFVNVDYQYTNYADARMQSIDTDPSSSRYLNEQTDNIAKYYQGVHTVRIGGELSVLNPVLLRVGAAYQTNPYQDIVGKDASALTVSAGIGLRFKYFFTDFAYSIRLSKDKGVFYDAGTLNPYTTSYTKSIFALTLGFKIGR